MTSVGITSEHVEDVGLAITEACTNVVAHTAGGLQYEVHVEFGAHDCHIRVIDTGIGFTAIGEHPTMPRPQSDHGRGIALMELLVDQIRLDSRPDEGTIVHLQKCLELTQGSPLRHLGPDDR